MLVFGDGETIEATGAKLARLGALVDDAEAATSGIGRHGLLVAALIEAGEIAQGIADAAFRAAGEIDAPNLEGSAAMRLTLALAKAVTMSWGAGFSVDSAPIASARTTFADLAAMALPSTLAIRPPEGFAFYALYPECYAAAAAALPRDEPPTVVGIRSIGTTLAAMVAAARGDTEPPATLRPVGHPFDRRVRLDPRLGRELSRAGCAAILDEGPGLSGSSLACVARAFEGEGLPLRRIHLMPGHDGSPGPAADAETRRVWQVAPRIVRSFEELVLHAANPRHRLRSWVEDVVGPLDGDLVEISGGAWRSLHAIPPEFWPPVHPWQERRKFIARAGGDAFLVKFVGLGRRGLAAERRARALAEAGFTTEPAGWRHGFLVEPWLAEARPLLRVPEDRNALIGVLAAYLAFRAVQFPADGAPGADVASLHAMAIHNARQAGLDEAAARLESWRPRLDALERLRRPVATDSRMQLWEWLDRSGRLVKSDALDHHAGHDLVGSQDIAWDVAGASVEFGLDVAETDSLMVGIERDGSRVDPELVALMLPCYLAFQLGAYTMAGQAAGGEESVRLRTFAERYRSLLATGHHDS